MTSHLSSSLAREQVGAELRNERRQVGATQEEVATAMDWSSSKVQRIERGDVSISTVDLRALLTYYNIADQQRTQELVALVRAARAHTSSTPGGAEQ